MKVKKIVEDLKPNELSESTKVSMRTRIISALVGLVVVVPPFLLGDWFFFALILAVTIISLFEAVRCGGKKAHFTVWMYLTTIVIGTLMVNWPLLQGLISDLSYGHAYNYFTSMNISLILTFIGICALFLVVILHDDFTVKHGCYIISMVLIISIGLQSILFVRFIPSVVNTEPRDGWFNSFDHFLSCTFAAYGILGTFATDIGAYFIGVFFGKHKLNERISPKKTVEGFFGGIFVSAIVSMGFAFPLAATGHPILPGVFDIEHWYNIVTMSLLMPLFATLGDFVFSAIKRTYETKDFGNIMPGHGGILDRLDSLVFVFAALALYTSLIYGLTTGGGLLV